MYNFYSNQNKEPEQKNLESSNDEKFEWLISDEEEEDEEEEDEEEEDDGEEEETVQTKRSKEDEEHEKEDGKKKTDKRTDAEEEELQIPKEKKERDEEEGMETKKQEIQWPTIDEVHKAIEFQMVSTILHYNHAVIQNRTGPSSGYYRGKGRVLLLQCNYKRNSHKKARDKDFSHGQGNIQILK